MHPNDNAPAHAPIALVQADRWRLDAANSRLAALLNDTLLLVVHRNVDKIGCCGETHLLVTENGTVREFVELRTSESQKILEELAPRIRQKSEEDAYEDDDED